MALLRPALRFAATAAKPLQASGLRTAQKNALGGVRSFVSRSAPRLGHNLEDHFDMAEFMCKMHHPLGEYAVWGLMFSSVITTFGPMVHSNYYFTGRFLPKDQGNTQLCDDSW